MTFMPTRHFFQQHLFLVTFRVLALLKHNHDNALSLSFKIGNVILLSDKRVIMKIVTSAQVMYYFTSAKHE